MELPGAASPGIYGGTSVYGSGTIQPVLFNYRFRFGDDQFQDSFLPRTFGRTHAHPRQSDLQQQRSGLLQRQLTKPWEVSPTAAPVGITDN